MPVPRSPQYGGSLPTVLVGPSSGQGGGPGPNFRPSYASPFESMRASATASDEKKGNVRKWIHGGCDLAALWLISGMGTHPVFINGAEGGSPRKAGEGEEPLHIPCSAPSTNHSIFPDFPSLRRSKKGAAPFGCQFPDHASRPASFRGGVVRSPS